MFPQTAKSAVKVQKKKKKTRVLYMLVEITSWEIYQKLIGFDVKTFAVKVLKLLVLVSCFGYN